MSDPTYVSSGQFRADLEALFGPLVVREEPDPVEDWMQSALQRLAAPVRAEVEALLTLHLEFELPELCRLRYSAFCTVADQYECDEIGLVDEFSWHISGDALAEQIKILMEGVEIFNDQGNPFVLVASTGVYHFYDDPAEVRLLCDDLGAYLRVLVAVQGAASGATPRDEARAILERTITGHRYESYLTRGLDT
ncbi:MAG: hypothetical protein R3E66_05870 [bacterium]